MLIINNRFLILYDYNFLGERGSGTRSRWSSGAFSFPFIGKTIHTPPLLIVPQGRRSVGFLSLEKIEEDGQAEIYSLDWRFLWPSLFIFSYPREGKGRNNQPWIKENSSSSFSLPLKREEFSFPRLMVVPALSLPLNTEILGY